METEKLYYADPFLTEFDARVLACEAVKDGFAVVLDRTAFYPEGGGQPYDTGVLGGAEVLDVHERAGVITHKCASPLPVGAAVHGKIDWARRFDHMQQHSGEHICSGLICARYGCDNVGFHMGAESVTIDFNADIPWEELLEIEAAANRYIYEDHAIDIQLHRGAELDAIDYRSKKPLEGDVRIVTFPGADCCACCGTHVMRSGQVGIVKFLSVQKFREGVRIELLCGGRAYRYLSACWAQDVAVAQALSVKPTASAAAVERLQGELSALKLRCKIGGERVCGRRGAVCGQRRRAAFRGRDERRQRAQALRRGGGDLRRALRGVRGRGQRVEIRHRAARGRSARADKGAERGALRARRRQAGVHAGQRRRGARSHRGLLCGKVT